MRPDGGDAVHGGDHHAVELHRGEHGAFADRLGDVFDVFTVEMFGVLERELLRRFSVVHADDAGAGDDVADAVAERDGLFAQGVDTGPADFALTLLTGDDAENRGFGILLHFGKLQRADDIR